MTLTREQADFIIDLIYIARPELNKEASDKATELEKQLRKEYGIGE